MNVSTLLSLLNFKFFINKKGKTGLIRLLQNLDALFVVLSMVLYTVTNQLCYFSVVSVVIFIVFGGRMAGQRATGI